MAALTTDNITILDTWYEGDRTGKQVFKCVKVLIVSGTAGTSANPINASIFGLSLIDSVSCKADTDNNVVIMLPGEAGDVLFNYLMTAAGLTPTDRAFGSASVTLIVKGIE